MGTVSKRLLGREEQYLVIMKLLLLSLLGCVAIQASPHHEEMKQIMNEIHTYNLRSQCWGEENVLAYDIAVLGATEKCMQLAPAYDLVELLKPINNPFSTLPGTVNNNPFQRLTNFQNVNQLTSLWRSKRQASNGLLNKSFSNHGSFAHSTNKAFVMPSQLFESNEFGVSKASFTGDGFGTSCTTFGKEFSKTLCAIRFVISGSKALSSQGFGAMSSSETFAMPRIIA